MTKSGQLVVGLLTNRLENGTMNASDKKRFVIKNEHTKVQMQDMEKRFVEHKGPYLTLQQVLELARTQQNQSPTHEKAA
jgi:hypothetical protein